MESRNEKIGKVTLDYTCYSGEDLYSEGADEDTLLELVKSNKKDAYNRRIAENSRWSMLYHLSHIRGNIVDFLPIGRKDRILEVGSGCGAITGTLAGKAGKVTCIELSKKRSLINAYRNQECDNVEIHVGNFQDIEVTLNEKYDFIMLIGVFEYAASYIQSTSPYEEFLNILSKHLVKGGKLVIAIENKYGLKYWAGCAEDHVGKFYEGIEGYSTTSGVRTFSRTGIENIARKCGCRTEFYYPYPDYKLPITIYSDAYLPKVGELTDNLRNFDAERVIAFDEALAFDEIIREGMFPHYSNSYLVLLQKEERMESFITRKPIYSKHSNERADEYRIRTDIERNGYGERFVVKYPYDGAANAHVKSMMKSYELQQKLFANTRFRPNVCRPVNSIQTSESGMEFEYLTGETMETKLDRLYDQGKQEELVTDIMEFAECVKNIPGSVDFYLTEGFTQFFGDVTLPGEQKCNKISNLDLIFSNVLINTEWNVIDYEWTFEFPIPTKFILYRAMFYYFTAEKEELLKKFSIYEKLGISDAEQTIFRSMEQHFQQKIIGERLSLVGMYSLMGRNAEKLTKLKRFGDLLPRKDRVKVYFDKGNGFSEENTCFYSASVDEDDRVTLEFTPEPEVQSVRIDPTAYPCMIRLHDFGMDEVSVNGMVFPEHTILYHTDDPQMILENIPRGRQVRVEYTITALRSDFFEPLATGVEQMNTSIFKKRKGPYEKVRLSTKTR